MKETEMERVAREAREFRENEARRIAAEKEEVRKAKELRKQLELARIALESAKFLKDAAEEQEAITRIKELEKQLHREEELRMVSGVSEKAQVLSEREELERRRAEEERRQKDIKSSHQFSHIISDTVSVGSCSDLVEGGGETVDSGFLPTEGATGYVDAVKSHFEKNSDIPNDDTTNVTRILKKRETMYYDANDALSQIESLVSSATIFSLPVPPSVDVVSDNNNNATAAAPAEIEREENVDSFKRGEQCVETVASEDLSQGLADHFNSVISQTPTEIEYSDYTKKTKILEKRETIYYDTQSTLSRMDSAASVASDSSWAPLQGREDIPDNSISTTPATVVVDGEEPIQYEKRENPALAMLLAGESDYLGRRTEVEEAGGLPESIIKRRSHMTSQKIGGGKSEPENDILAHHGALVASYEIPLEYNSTGGNFVIGRAAEVSLSTSMAPSRLEGRWSGVIEGKASVGPSAVLDQAVGSVTLDYLVNRWSKFSLGMIRGHERFHPLITIGGCLMHHGSVLGITFYHNASFLRSMLLEHSMYSIAFRHSFPKSRWIFSSEVSRRQEISLSLCNAKVASTVSWSLRKPNNATARLELRPTVSEDRGAHVFGEFRSSGIWQVGASLVQSLHSSMATVGLGVRLYSTRGLEWVISWTRGEATVRIPVLVSSGITNVHIGHVLYFTMLSFLIQEGIAEIWGWKHPGMKPSIEKCEKSKPAMATVKSRHDAELQQGLMVRQAMRKRREETEKEGLVIHEATYAVKGGDSWQVTIPLQFWVNQSSLALPPKPKSQLLGFYGVDIVESTEKTEIPRHEKDSPSGSVKWWKDVLSDLMGSPSGNSDGPKVESSGPTPTLEVLYDYQGQRYQITISDDEELILPNPTAKKV